jgi:glycine cleavage system H lipoate-binding protein/TusA-related sulfurtransferase
LGNCYFEDRVLNDVENNVWAKMGSDGVATVGINTILAWMGGPFKTVTFRDVGAVVERGKSLGSVESLRHFDVVRSPLSGTILEVNSKLREDPRLLNRDTYAEGWFAKLKPSAYSTEVGYLSDTSSARPALERKIEQLMIHCLSEFPDHEMFEIGTECSAVLTKLDELLAHVSPGQVVHLVTDDPAASIEMVRWSDRTGHPVVEDEREGKLVHFLVRKSR